IAALGVLAEQTDKLRAKQEVAASSFKEGTSIINEFNNVNNNLAANLEKIQNRLSTIWENSKIRATLTEITRSLLDTDTAAQKLLKSFEIQKSSIQDLEANAYPLIARYDQ